MQDGFGFAFSCDFQNNSLEIEEDNGFHCGLSDHLLQEIQLCLAMLDHLKVILMEVDRPVLIPFILLFFRHRCPLRYVPSQDLLHVFFDLYHDFLVLRLILLHIYALLQLCTTATPHDHPLLASPSLKIRTPNLPP